MLARLASCWRALALPGVTSTVSATKQNACSPSRRHGMIALSLESMYANEAKKRLSHVGNQHASKKSAVADRPQLIAPAAPKRDTPLVADLPQLGAPAAPKQVNPMAAESLWQICHKLSHPPRPRSSPH